MFFSEYYFGYSRFAMINRIIGGPFLVLVGCNLYNSNDKFGIAYAGFCIAYGIYFTLKPLLWVLFRIDSFKTINFGVQPLEDRIIFREDLSQTEVLYERFRRIFRRKYYYVFETEIAIRIYVPFSFLSDNQIILLDAKLKP
jgi:hypothetical protein